MKVADLLSSALVAEGCRTVFGLVGDGNITLWGTIGRDGVLPLRSAWTEGAAIAMADGWARSTGAVGVATVTSGPGLTHAATALVSAARHGSPLVVLVGDLPAGSIGSNQLLDQRRFARACGVRFHAATEPAGAATAMRAAFRDARRHSAPVILSIPIDVQEAELPARTTYRPAPRRPRVPDPDPATLAMIADLLAASRHPVLVAGRGAVHARDAILDLAEVRGAAVGTSLQAKDRFAGHPRNIGVLGGIAHAVTRQALEQADLVIAFGSTLGYHTTDKRTQLTHARIVRIDIREGAGGDGPPSTVNLRADAAAAARALSAALAQRPMRKSGFIDPAWSSRLPVAAEPKGPFAADGIDPRLLMREASRVLPSGVQVSVGIGHFWAFPILWLDLPQDASFHSLHSFGSIGFALPFAGGLATAAPDRPVLAIEGDGSLMQALAELESAARQGISLTVLVMNDGGYGAEAHKLAVKGFAEHSVRWPHVDFAALARQFGGHGSRVERIEEAGPALAQAFARGGVNLIDARISPTVLSEFYRKNLFGQQIP